MATDVDFSFYEGNVWSNNCFPKLKPLEADGGTIEVSGDARVWINYADKNWVYRSKRSSNKINSTQTLSVSYLADTLAPQTSITFALDTIAQEGNAFISWNGIDCWENTPKENLTYSYKLNNGKWSKFSLKNNHTFLSLPSGKHTFSVRAKDSDFNIDKTPAIIEFYVIPPIWKRPWFIGMILIFLITILYLVWRILLRNTELASLNKDLSLAYGQLEVQKEEILRKNEEVHQAKLRFFTNISHEFRTPLTLLLGPIKLLKEGFNKEKARKYLPIIERNANLLLNLVSEIMDFRKLETGKEKLKATETDIVTFIAKRVTDFKQLAKQKGVIFEFNTLIEEGMLWVDHEKMSKIILNLVSNALKFTPTNGKICISISNGELKVNEAQKNTLVVNAGESPLKEFIEIAVEDNGLGISEESISHIFGRFYQVDNASKHLGSGIGLALTKELIQLHRGDIIVRSKRDVGTTFTIRLPLGNDHLRPEEIIRSRVDFEPEVNYNTTGVNEMAEDEVQQQPKSDAPEKTLLIVDDNIDIRTYIKDGFVNGYTIVEAEDGITGLENAKENAPDLIISDVMMPNMNGLEFCNQIKSHLSTSHIPVILLTARSSKEHQLEGLQTGADLYVSKPFDLELLQAQVANIFSSRARVIQHLQTRDLFQSDVESYTSLDQVFLKNLAEKTEAYFAEPEFKVDALSEELGVSVRNLYNKLKALTGLTPAEYLRKLRIKKAEDLLLNTDLTASEISFKTGFSHPAHFNRVFKQKHNCTPLQFAEKNKN